MAFFTVASPLRALPHPNEPIDPTKRASMSTEDAARPAAMPLQQTGVVGGRVIRMSEIPIRRADLTGDGVKYQTKESRPKNVLSYPTKRTDVREFGGVRSASDMPAMIPRIRPDRFRKMIGEYEKGRVPADEFLKSSIEVGGGQVDMGEINKFANPRRALEDQGIPVRRAGSSGAETREKQPVPIPTEKP